MPLFGHEWSNDVAHALRQQNEAMRAENARLRAALVTYGAHLETCHPGAPAWSGWACTCGLDDIRGEHRCANCQGRGMVTGEVDPTTRKYLGDQPCQCAAGGRIAARALGRGDAMNDKHSPGPWRVAGTSVEDLNEAPILQRHAASDISDDTARANAEIAAIAPQLLEALREAVDRVWTTCVVRTEEGWERPRWLLAARALVDGTP